MKQLITNFEELSIVILAFNTTAWDDTVDKVTGRWRNFYTGYVLKGRRFNVPVHVVYYENLKQNVTREIEGILDFYKTAIGFEPANAQDRIDCITKEHV